MTLLVGDIGGTHGRFGVVETGSLRPRALGVEEGDAHATFAEAVAAYLEKSRLAPERAAFAIAGPVGDGRRARITNRQSWEIDAEALERRFGFARVTLMNDFVAQAASLPHLGRDELIAIGAPAPDKGVKAAVGPGTGLGVAALLPVPGGWLPLASEGGHVEFASVDAREAAAFEIIRRARGRVSAEDVLSGPGLSRLHAALGQQAAGETTGAIDPAEIVARAEAGEAAAAATVRLFLTMLARFAGDIALSFGASGGVYLCGGVVPRLAGLLDAAAFRAAFEAKGPHRGLMERTATRIVTSPIAGLIGCAAQANGRVSSETK